MCGIAGILQFTTSTDIIPEQILHRMGDAIAHRGPDDAGIYLSRRQHLGFSFRRLSIIDLSQAGHQPMITPDGNTCIVFNGEIYNHLELRRQLESAGYQYRSRTDTETILYAFDCWGESFIERLDGMFAIALWSEHEQVLRLFRDRIGIKPIYYAVQDQRFIFGSEIKAILATPYISPEVDTEALYHYLTFIHTPAPLTLFKGVRKLEPGHMLKIATDGSVSERTYWTIPSSPSGDVDMEDEDAVCSHLKSLLIESIDKRMMSDVPFGVFLSGGIDSSANVALMAQLMDRPVETFSVAIKGQEDTNEFAWARKVSRLFETHHHEIIIDDSGFLDLLPAIIHHQDEPLADPVCFPLYHVSKLARDNNVIVVQVGEGSDEQFAGYKSYHRMHALMTRWRWVSQLPRSFRQALYSALVPLLKFKKVDYRQNVIRNLLDGGPVYLSNALAFYDREKEHLLASTELARKQYPSSTEFMESAVSRFSAQDHPDFLARMIFWELKNRLAELLLMRVDKITMANSIEARVPFLDHKIVEFSMGIPEKLKLKNGVTKYVLKKSLRGLLPDEIIDRRKIGFAGSGKNMLTPEIFAHAKSLLLHPHHQYFNQEYVSELLSEYERTRINYTPQIWTLYNFELWHRYWIEGDTALQL
ncbi:MAG: asparagine synthase (glutamine-hydrolyzing) [Chlorobi bacterium]|nr:asparagine synthase (glutamine-hydrolyzing) [Chlorobiota bacterium]